MGKPTYGLYTSVYEFVEMPMYACMHKQIRTVNYLIVKFYLRRNKTLSCLVFFKAVVLNSCLRISDRGSMGLYTYIFFFRFYLFIYLFLAALGLHCCARAFSSCGERGPLFIAVRGLLIAVACLCCKAQALGARASVVVARWLSRCGSRDLERGLSSCGTRASLLRSMWDLPGPGIEPMPPALAGGFLTTVPPGKSIWDCILT